MRWLLFRLAALVGIAFIALSVWVMFVILPVLFYAEAECLRHGYPKAEVTIGLERYCMTLDGAVTTKVEKMP